MISRLEFDVDNIPDWLVGKAMLALQIFLAHSANVEDADKLIDFCLSALTKMKDSIDRARFNVGEQLTGSAPERAIDDKPDLKSIVYTALHESG